MHDAHIWIGDESTQEKYGTAAYKMVELDDGLGGIAVQHCKVQERESEKILLYFKNRVTYLSGGGWIAASATSIRQRPNRTCTTSKVSGRTCPWCSCQFGGIG